MDAGRPRAPESQGSASSQAPAPGYRVETHSQTQRGGTAVLFLLVMPPLCTQTALSGLLAW